MRPFLCVLSITATIALISACRTSQQQQGGGKVRDPKAVTASSCEASIPPPGLMFPSGFDYPQTEAAIHAFPNGHRQRLHAYCVFAGLNYPWTPGSPTWTTWKTTTQAFLYQYNQWPSPPPAGLAAAAAMTQRTVPINVARSRAAGAVGKIVNPAPTYYVNAAVANNPRYQNAGCLQAQKNAQGQILGYTLRDGQIFQSNGDIMVAAVSYSPFALQDILGRQLYDGGVLDKQLPKLATDPSNSMKPMGHSVVLKVMLWPVSGTSPTALPYWNWDANAPGSPSDGQYAGYEMQKFWTNAVAITNGPAPPSVTFLYGVRDPTDMNWLPPNTYQNPQAVPLNRFYGHTYTADELGALSPCDQALLDASSFWSFNRGFRDGDSLVMIAMHIMTKEQSDWTFQSAWWHPNALPCTSNTRFCQDRPTTVPGGDTTYMNYNMSTTYGQQQEKSKNFNGNYYAPTDTKGPIWPVAYNPYIELAASHPITTNCMNCHHRAAWPPNSELFPDKKDKGRVSAYLQTTSPNPNVLEVFDPSNKAFNGLLMLDSMWAISDRAGYPTNAQATTPR